MGNASKELADEYRRLGGRRVAVIDDILDPRATGTGIHLKPTHSGGQKLPHCPTESGEMSRPSFRR